MTSRERTQKALTFSKPDRAPRHLWMLPYVSMFRKAELDAVLDKYPSDIDSPAVRPPGEIEESHQKFLHALTHTGSYTDEWGSVWEVGEPGIVGEVKQPVLADWARLDTFQPPWEVVEKRDLGHANRVCDGSDKFMPSANCARPFERLQFLRGTESALMDLASDEPEIRKTLDMIHEYESLDVSAWAKSNVDGAFLMDDWGSAASTRGKSRSGARSTGSTSFRSAPRTMSGMPSAGFALPWRMTPAA
ncbi:MAG: hypothetical protein WC003_16620 [Terrimicrobiaceae bacterium]